MKTIQYNVGLVLDVPDVGATEQQVEEWVKFQTGYTCEILMSNPLEGHDLDANWIEVERH